MSDLQKQTDVVIGMVTASTLERPNGLVDKITTGMATYFPQYSWVLVNAVSGRSHRDEWETTTSLENLISIQLARCGVHEVTCPWHGVPAKTNGYRAILEVAQRRKAPVCLLIDPAQRGFESTWIDSLIRPGVHSKYDLVTPIYNGCEREQLMSRNLLSPMLRTLFGTGPKQPASGELLISARLLNRLLARHDWESAPARYTPEFWISFIAAAEGYRMAESYVGPSARQPGVPHVTLQTAIEQILGSLLTLMEQYENCWPSPARSVELDCFGQLTAVCRASARQDGLDYLVRFVDAFPALRSQWQIILDPHTFAEIEEFQTSLREGETSRILRDAVWVRIAYEIAAAWKHRTLPRRQVLGLFPSLFLARAGSFLMRTQWVAQPEVEAELARLAEMFEVLHDVLPGLWSGVGESNAGGRAKRFHGMEAA